MARKMDIGMYNRTYYQRHKEKALERARQYYYAHREERLEYQKKYQKEFLASLSPEERSEFYKMKNYKIKKI